MARHRLGNAQNEYFEIEQKDNAGAIKVTSTDIIAKATPVADRAALIARVGTFDGEAVWQSDIGLMYIWKSSGVIENGGTQIGTGAGWVASYTGAVNIKWFGVVQNSSVDSSSNTTAIQYMVDNFTHIIGSLSNQYEIEGITISKVGVKIENLNLKLKDGVNSNIIQISEGATGTKVINCETHFNLQGGGYDVSGIDIYKANSVTIQGCYTSGSYCESYDTAEYTNANIAAFGCYHLTVENCYGTNGIYETIMLKDCHYSSITNTTIKDTYGSLGFSVGSHNIVSNCHAINVHHSSISFNSTFGTVSNCVCDGSYSTDGFHGINIGHVGVDRHSEGVTVSNCVVRNQNDSGIAVASPKGTTIVGCTVDNVGKHGIYIIGEIDDIVISDNVVSYTGNGGIFCQNDNESANSKVSITGNIFKNLNTGMVWLHTINTFNIANNNVHNAYNNNDTDSYYIRFSFCGGGNISNNLMDSSTAASRPDGGFKIDSNDSITNPINISDNIILDWDDSIIVDATAAPIKDLITWSNNRISTDNMYTIQDVSSTTAGDDYACLNSNICGFTNVVVYPQDATSVGNIFITAFPGDESLLQSYIRYTAETTIDSESSFKLVVL